MNKASLLVLLSLPVLACATTAPTAPTPSEPAPVPPPVAPAGTTPTIAEEAPPAPELALARRGATEPEGRSQTSGRDDGRTGREFRFAVAGPDERAEAVVALARLPAGWPRVREAAAAFLGVRYAASPLGEGEGGDFDRDPRARYDAVDCVTFVETALAIGNATTLADAERLLDEIRYKDGAAPSFANRLHFFEAQWIPEQIRRGYVVDVTRSFAGPASATASISFTPESWASRVGFREVDVPWEQAPQGTFELPVVPLALVRERAEELPDGVLLNVIRENKPGIPTIVSHTGFVVVKDGLRFLRHATPTQNRVIDEPIASFLGRHARMKEWKVRGVNLLAIRDNTAHAREVLASTANATR